jgi:hypothetical protein
MESVEQTVDSQVELLFAILFSSGFLLILIFCCAGLILGAFTSLSRKAFFTEGYFKKITSDESVKGVSDNKLNTTHKATVFVSYSHADSSFVDRLVEDLKKGNINVWIDKWMIRVGDSITGRVNEEISSSDFLIIVLSASSVNSKWVREEINTALIRNIEHGKQAYILPLLIEDCEVPPLLRHRKYANFKDDYTKGYLELTEAIQYQTNDL